MVARRDDRNAQVRARNLTARRMENKYPELWAVEYALAKETIRREQLELEKDLDGDEEL